MLEHSNILCVFEEILTWRDIYPLFFILSQCMFPLNFKKTRILGGKSSAGWKCDCLEGRPIISTFSLMGQKSLLILYKF